MFICNEETGKLQNKYYKVCNESRYKDIAPERFDTLDEAQDYCKELIKEKALMYGADINLRIYCVIEESVAIYDSSTMSMKDVK